MTELAGRIGAPLSSVSDEVARLERAGILSTRLLGRARLVRAATGPLVEPLTMLVLRAFGPIQVIAEELADLADVERVLLFGSWAARYRGQKGPEPNDSSERWEARADSLLEEIASRPTVQVLPPESSKAIVSEDAH